MEQTYMKTRKILPLVLSMSLPMVLSMLVNSLYNIVDSYFVARISDEAMTALSLVYPIQILVNSVAVGFGIGINSAAAYFLGAKNHRKANNMYLRYCTKSCARYFIYDINDVLCTIFYRLIYRKCTGISLQLEIRLYCICLHHSKHHRITFEKIFQQKAR